MKEIFIFLFYLIKICYFQGIFHITISNNPHYNETNIKIIKGKYNTLYANVIFNETLIKEISPINTFTSISLDNNIKQKKIFKLLNDNFTIDLTEGNIFTFEFGISCNSNVDLNEIYTILLSSSDSNFIINEFNITIITENDLKLYIINSSILFIEYEKIKNVDDINLTINYNNKNENFTIYSYNESSLLLYTFKKTKVNITAKNTCFNISYDEDEKEIPNLKTDFKGIFFQNSILSMKIEDSSIINSLNISLNFDFKYVLLFCSLTEINNDFLNQSEVISQKKKKGYYNIYKYLNESEQKLILFFDNLNMYKDYKMICYFKYINHNNLIYENLTFGNFLNSDYKINLRPKYSINNINPVNCINFNFNNLTEREEEIFIEKIIKICENYFLTNEKRIWNKCIKRNLNTTIGICVISTNNNTRNEHYKEIFNNFISYIIKKLNISDSIIKKYNISDLENDNEEPNPKKISFSNFVLENNIIKFESKNENSNIQCYTLLTNRILENIEPIDFKDFIIIKKEKEVFQINIKEELIKKNINLNLIFQCYNLPHFNYHYLHSSPFIVLQIINNSIKTSNFKSFPNCNDLNNKFLPQCFNMSSNLTLNSNLTKFLIPNYLNYPILTNQQQNKDNLFLEIENLKKNLSKYNGKTNNEELKKYLFTFSIQLYLTKCNNYIDYEYCFNEKNKIINKIINIYNTTLLSQQNNNPSDSFIITLLSFYYLTISIDSFSYENTINLIQIIYNFFSVKLMENIENVVLYYYILDNLISSITFSQFQNNIFVIDNNNIIQDNKFALIPFILKKLCTYNEKVDNLNVNFNNFNYYKIKKKNKTSTLYYKDHDVNITIPIPKDKQKINANHYYCIVQYFNYPLFNYREKDKYYNKVYQISYIYENTQSEFIKNFPIIDGIDLEFNNSNKNKFCYYFDYKKTFISEKISNVRFTQNEVITYRNNSNETYIKCRILQFGDITIGKNDINGIIYIEDTYGIWNIIILIILIILLIIVLIIIIFQQIKNTNNNVVIENDGFSFNTLLKSEIE